MNKLLLAAVAVLFCLNADAQESYLGKTKSYIKDLLYKNNYIQLGKDIVTGTTTQLDFGYFDTSKYGDKEKVHGTGKDIPNNTTPTATVTCILENDTCAKYIVSYMPADVPGVLRYLNTKYKKIDETHWASAGGLYELGTYNMGEAFAIEFRKSDN